MTGQLTMKVMKKRSLWAIPRKVPYRIFYNMPHWNVPRVPRNTTSLVFLLHSFWKTRAKSHRVDRIKINRSMANFFNLQHAKVIVDKVEVRFKAEILNGSVTYVNTKTGYSMNMSIDINEELDNISVICMKFYQRFDRF
jgi:hypothetical protein